MSGLVRGISAVLVGVMVSWASPALAQIATIPTAPATEAVVEGVVADYGYNIRIEGTPEFVEQSVGLLDRLAELPSGRRILEEVGGSGKLTVLRRTTDLNAYASALEAADFVEAILSYTGERGAGADALVRWNPDLELVGMPPEVLLGHELIHAIHLQRGEALINPKQAGHNAGTRWEELRTIGIDGYEGEELTENVLRGEWNASNPDALIPPARNGHGVEDFGEDVSHELATDFPGDLSRDEEPSGEDEVRTVEVEQPRARGALDILKKAFWLD
ncbi:MAG: hypothetical protein JKY65_08250 [Planctomycetes bacterium]|nr:hypothetical protein [Planctomycetota bacterium]